jgi:hypothetical protein
MSMKLGRGARSEGGKVRLHPILSYTEHEKKNSKSLGQLPYVSPLKKYQCCGSGIFTNPGSRISDPRSRIQKQQQKRGVKKN